MDEKYKEAEPSEKGQSSVPLEEIDLSLGKLDIELGSSRFSIRKQGQNKPKTLFALADILAFLATSTTGQSFKFVLSSLDQSQKVLQKEWWVTRDGFLKVVYSLGTPEQQIIATHKLTPFFLSLSTKGDSKSEEDDGNELRNDETNNPMVDMAPDNLREDQRELLSSSLIAWNLARTPSPHLIFSDRKCGKVMRQVCKGSQFIDFLLIQKVCMTNSEANKLADFMISRNLLIPISSEERFRDKSLYWIPPKLTHRTSVIVLGPKSSGKTSLCNIGTRLSQGPLFVNQYQYLSTWPFDQETSVRQQLKMSDCVDDLNAERSLRITFWDFEDPCCESLTNENIILPQTTFYTSTQRAVYVIVFNAATVNVCELDEWIFSENIPKIAPILVIGTHIDLLTKPQIEFLEAMLNSRYSRRVSEVILTSLKSKAPSKLIQSIINHVMKHTLFDEFEQNLPDHFPLLAETKLFSLRSNNYIPFSQFAQLAQEAGVPKVYIQSTASFLHSVGSILIPQNNVNQNTTDTIFQDDHLVILNHDWIYDLLAQVRCAKVHTLQLPDKLSSGNMWVNDIIAVWKDNKVPQDVIGPIFRIFFHYGTFKQLDPLRNVAVTAPNPILFSTTKYRIFDKKTGKKASMMEKILNPEEKGVLSRRRILGGSWKADGKLKLQQTPIEPNPSLKWRSSSSFLSPRSNESSEESDQTAKPRLSGSGSETPTESSPLRKRGDSFRDPASPTLSPRGPEDPSKTDSPRGLRRRLFSSGSPPIPTHLLPVSPPTSEKAEGSSTNRDELDLQDLLSQLCQYSKMDSLPKLKNLLEAYPQHLPKFINLRDSHGYTALYYASEKGNVQCLIELLKQASVDVHAKSSKGTALHIAVKKKNPEIVGLLLLKGADPDLSSPDLHSARSEARGEYSELFKLKENDPKQLEKLFSRSYMFKSSKQTQFSENVAEIPPERKLFTTKSPPNQELFIRFLLPNENETPRSHRESQSFPYGIEFQRLIQLSYLPSDFFDLLVMRMFILIQEFFPVLICSGKCKILVHSMTLVFYDCQITLKYAQHWGSSCVHVTFRGLDMNTLNTFRVIMHVFFSLIGSFAKLTHETLFLDPPEKKATEVKVISFWNKTSIWTLDEAISGIFMGQETISNDQQLSFFFLIGAPDLKCLDLTMNVDPSRITNIESIGQGAYGTVWKVLLKDKTRESSSEVAMKELILPTLGKVSHIFSAFCEEVWFLSRISHPNIVQLIGFHIGNEQNSATKKLCLILELLPLGDLYSYLSHNKTSVGWDFRLEIATDIASALEYLHSKSILHHDVKSLNILLGYREGSDIPIGKLADFGEAKLFNSLTKRDKIDNPTWLAPEVINNEVYTQKSEVYSFAIILWELLCQQHPFQEYEVSNSPFRADFEKAILDGLRPSDAWRNTPDLHSDALVPYVTLMKSCWVVDPQSRPLFTPICQKLNAILSLHHGANPRTVLRLPQLPVAPAPVTPTNPTSHIFISSLPDASPRRSQSMSEKSHTTPVLPKRTRSPSEALEKRKRVLKTSDSSNKIQHSPPGSPK